MQFNRFATLKAMEAFAVDHFKKSSGKIYAEASIYTDNNGLSYRPQIILIEEGQDDICLKWNYYTDEQDIDFIGKRMRVEAREKAEWIVNYIQASITLAANTLPMTEKEVRTALGMDTQEDNYRVHLHREGKNHCVSCPLATYEAALKWIEDWKAVDAKFANDDLRVHATGSANFIENVEL